MTPRSISTFAPTALVVAVLACGFASTASADPQSAPLDRERAALLDEMRDHIERWKPRPTTLPEATPARPDSSRPDPDLSARSAQPSPLTAAHRAPLTADPSAEAASADEPTSSSDAPIPLGRHDAKRIAEAVLIETNAARERHGLAPIDLHPVLNAAAIDYAGHLARTGHFGHIDLTRPGLEDPGDRVRAAGGVDVLAAENLITETWLQVDGGEQLFVLDEARHRYSRTPDGPPIEPHTARTMARSMVQRWLESPGHRRNILDAEGRQMGFGMAWDPRAAIPSLVAVQVFQRYHPLNDAPTR